MLTNDNTWALVQVRTGV